MIDEYARRAQQFRPSTVEAVRETARRMAAEGMGDHTIASALQVSVEQVRRILGRCGDCG